MTPEDLQLTSAEIYYPHPKVPVWLIDISNTFTKCTLFQKGRYSRRLRFPTASATASIWKKIHSEYSKPETIVVSSVVPKVSAAFRKLYPNAHFLTGSSQLPIRLEYPKPKEIGADRIANAIALHALGRFPAIAVDFGTAITLDILDENGAYVGGVIAPGLQSMLCYLHDKTALLPLATLKGIPKPIGQNTLDAIRSGIYFGYIGLVNNIIKNAAEHLNQYPKLIVATGGDSLWISKNVNLIQKNLPDLTMDGLRIYAEYLLHFPSQKSNTKITAVQNFSLGKPILKP